MGLRYTLNRYAEQWARLAAWGMDLGGLVVLVETPATRSEPPTRWFVTIPCADDLAGTLAGLLHAMARVAAVRAPDGGGRVGAIYADAVAEITGTRIARPDLTLAADALRAHLWRGAQRRNTA